MSLPAALDSHSMNDDSQSMVNYIHTLLDPMIQQLPFHQPQHNVSSLESNPAFRQHLETLLQLSMHYLEDILLILANALEPMIHTLLQSADEVQLDSGVTDSILWIVKVMDLCVAYYWQMIQPKQENSRTDFQVWIRQPLAQFVSLSPLVLFRGCHQVDPPAMDESLARSLLSKLGSFFYISEYNSTMAVLQSGAGKLLFYLGASNSDILFHRILSRMQYLVNANEEGEEIWEFHLLENMCLNQQRLLQVMVDLCAVARHFKRTAQIAAAQALRQAIWGWITFYPAEFMAMTHQKKWEGAPEQLFEIFAAFPETGKRKFALWPICSLLLLLCPDVLMRLMMNDKINDLSPRKVQFIDTMRKHIKQTKLTEITATVYVDICRISSLVSRAEISPLRHIVPDVENELAQKLFDLNKPFLTATSTEEEIHLVLDYLVAAYRLNAHSVQRTLVPLCLNEEMHPIYRLVLVQACWQIASDKSRHPQLNIVYHVLAHPLRDLFHSLVQKEKQRKQRHSEDDPFSDLILLSLLKLYAADPILALYSDDEMLRYNQTSSFLHALTMCLNDDVEEISFVALQTLASVHEPKVFLSWDRATHRMHTIWQLSSQIMTLVSQQILSFKSSTSTTSLTSLCSLLHQLMQSRWTLIQSLDEKDRLQGSQCDEREQSCIALEGALLTISGHTDASVVHWARQMIQTFLLELSQCPMKQSLLDNRWAYESWVQGRVSWTEALRGIQTATLGNLGAWEEMYQRFVQLSREEENNTATVVSGTSSMSSTVSSAVTAAVIASAQSATDSMRRKLKKREAAAAPTASLSSTDLNEWRQIVLFLCSLGSLASSNPLQLDRSLFQRLESTAHHFIQHLLERYQETATQSASLSQQHQQRTQRDVIQEAILEMPLSYWKPLFLPFQVEYLFLMKLLIQQREKEAETRISDFISALVQATKHFSVLSMSLKESFMFLVQWVVKKQGHTETRWRYPILKALLSENNSVVMLRDLCQNVVIVDSPLLDELVTYFLEKSSSSSASLASHALTGLDYLIESNPLCHSKVALFALNLLSKQGSDSLTAYLPLFSKMKDFPITNPVSLYDLLEQNDAALLHHLCDTCPPALLDDLSFSLLVSYVATSRCRWFMQSLIEREVERTDLAPNLFRRNSVASKCLTLYAKILASDYLYSVVVPIVEMMRRESELSYEMDPMKEGFSQTAVDQLCLVCERFLDHFFVIPLPPCLTLICQLLAESIQIKFPESLMSSLGGYLFLRLLNPCLVAPESVGWIESTAITKQMRRGWVLMTKVLQNLANGISFGGKEQFMMPMNTVLEKYHDPMVQYLNQSLVAENETVLKGPLVKPLGQLYSAVAEESTPPLLYKWMQEQQEHWLTDESYATAWQQCRTLTADPLLMHLPRSLRFFFYGMSKDDIPVYYLVLKNNLQLDSILYSLSRMKHYFELILDFTCFDTLVKVSLKDCPVRKVWLLHPPPFWETWIETRSDIKLISPDHLTKYFDKNYLPLKGYLPLETAQSQSPVLQQDEMILLESSVEGLSSVQMTLQQNKYFFILQGQKWKWFCPVSQAHFYWRSQMQVEMKIPGHWFLMKWDKLFVMPKSVSLDVSNSLPVKRILYFILELMKLDKVSLLLLESLLEKMNLDGENHEGHLSSSRMALDYFYSATLFHQKCLALQLIESKGLARQEWSLYFALKRTYPEWKSFWLSLDSKIESTLRLVDRVHWRSANEDWQQWDQDSFVISTPIQKAFILMKMMKEKNVFIAKYFSNLWRVALPESMDMKQWTSFLQRGLSKEKMTPMFYSQWISLLVTEMKVTPSLIPVLSCFTLDESLFKESIQWVIHAVERRDYESLCAILECLKESLVTPAALIVILYCFTFSHEKLTLFCMDWLKRLSVKESIQSCSCSISLKELDFKKYFSISLAFLVMKSKVARSEQDALFETLLEQSNLPMDRLVYSIVLNRAWPEWDNNFNTLPIAYLIVSLLTVMEKSLSKGGLVFPHQWQQCAQYFPSDSISSVSFYLLPKISLTESSDSVLLKALTQRPSQSLRPLLQEAGMLGLLAEDIQATGKDFKELTFLLKEWIKED